MELSELKSVINTPSRQKAFARVLTDEKIRRISLDGLEGSSVAFALLHLLQLPGASFVVANDSDEAGYLFHDIEQIEKGEHVVFFPSGYKRDIKYGQIDAPAGIMRTDVLNRLKRKEPLLVVTYPEALAEKVVPEKVLEKNTLHITRSEPVDVSFVGNALREYGFKKVDYVYEPGQYAVRGSILDVFSYSNEYPYRIDFFGEDVESIRTFDVETQLSRENLEEVYIIPNVCNQVEKGISILDFIEKNTCIAFRDVQWTLARIRATAGETLAEQALLTEEVDTHAMEKVVDADLFARQIEQFRWVEYGKHSLQQPQATITYHCSLQGIYHKNFELVSESFSRLIADGYSLYITSDSEKQTDRLRDIFGERGDEIKFVPVLRTLHEGFVDNDLRICCFTDHQIFDRFHKYSLKSDRARSGKMALSLRELQQIEVGDYLVHVDHGIGQFGGLTHTEIAGKRQEAIKVIYKNGDLIYVSIHSLHKLSKYRSKEGEAPKLNRLGTGAWERMKERTKSKMKDIARDLIKLYAARREEKGFAFSPDNFMQHELEASFIYEDTPDQLKATQEVKADMESARPMDRLICGDVGFGKTEVAIRAAFKAACDNKQVAVLVPTTVLAFQHYRTFTERLKEFPVRIEYLSRARKAADVKALLKELADGKINILIGTHRIIGKDVKFKDLGLLIIDEEQKFGVAVKEKLKQMKVNVDTLTMSATPIPRTLQFSLMGARDLSAITTPPANRYPILTEVHTFGEDIIREAINFEMSRNGQLFFVNNQIESLYTLRDLIKRLVPDARVVVGHGQMPPAELEKVIMDFVHYDYDVLLATTIIENGIDMPNANTIIINQAQNFGLSELHQLRGRVGRSNRKAFCYLLVPPQQTFTEEARRRLQAIESFSDLGSGIHIAMQDLDIRGAGNLLGAEQSGFIADLGYETYQKILQEAVEELKTQEFSELYYGDGSVSENREYVSDCQFESDLELMLPDDYVPQEAERISLYRELDGLEQEREVAAFCERLRDRFGAIPAVTLDLVQVVNLRRVAKELGFEKVSLKQGKMYLYFVGDEHKAYYQSEIFGRVLNYLQQNPRRCKLRELGGRRSMVVQSVSTVLEAVQILKEMSRTVAV
ncbi:MAG TPA: transcription-repair coupling factor [Candidatus Barnesiella excrementipullorum]|uniref:Transcription-repair-coupling factor n=1 Tax=Candidatus Barnesiella excrementipullorum TaxID=2838479 RepID=A0A9D1VR16_9BACT|nr:transcription-repair coupling factor [Candidatus Barnesiella excrementipullorum]